MKNKNITLPIKIIIVGCIIGLITAGIGVYKQVDAQRINKERAEAALKASQEAVDKANTRLKEIESEYNTLKSQYETKNKECNSIDNNMNASDWYEKSTKCHNEEQEIKSQMNDLEMENTTIKNKDYTGYYQEVKPMSYYIFYIIGGSIAVLAALVAFIIYLVKGKKTY